MKNNRVAVIGAGPAGLAASLQLHRHAIPFQLYEKKRGGGLLWNANWVENYLGFPEGISGSELVSIFMDQIAKCGIKLIQSEVKSASYGNQMFVVNTDLSKEQYRYLVVASGTKPKELRDIQWDEEARNRILYEVAELLGISGKRIVIIGAGDAAFDYALNLCTNNQVHLLNRTEKTKCLPILKERAFEEAQIEYQDWTTVSAISVAQNGDLITNCNYKGNSIQIHADYVIGAIGRIANLDFLDESIISRKDELVSQGSIYFIGDVTSGLYRQTAIATGQGINVAMSINALREEF